MNIRAEQGIDLGHSVVLRRHGISPCMGSTLSSSGSRIGFHGEMAQMYCFFLTFLHGVKDCLHISEQLHLALRFTDFSVSSIGEEEGELPNRKWRYFQCILI